MNMWFLAWEAAIRPGESQAISAGCGLSLEVCVKHIAIRMLIICEKNGSKASSPAFSREGEKVLARHKVSHNIQLFFPVFNGSGSHCFVEVGLNKRLEFLHFPLCFPQSLADHRGLIG